MPTWCFTTRESNKTFVLERWEYFTTLKYFILSKDKPLGRSINRAYESGFTYSCSTHITNYRLKFRLAWVFSSSCAAQTHTATISFRLSSGQSNFPKIELRNCSCKQKVMTVYNCDRTSDCINKKWTIKISF